jgi:hypothetical protein
MIMRGGRGGAMRMIMQQDSPNALATSAAYSIMEGTRAKEEASKRSVRATPKDSCYRSGLTRAWEHAHAGSGRALTHAVYLGILSWLSCMTRSSR